MRAIRCKLCDKISWNPHDIEQKYCGNCHAFLEDGQYEILENVYDWPDEKNPDKLRSEIENLKARLHTVEMEKEMMRDIIGALKEQAPQVKIREDQIVGRALKGSWMVTAGLLVGETVDDFTRFYQYPDKDYDQDIEMKEPDEGVAIFRKMTHEAYQIHSSLTDPSVANWVKLEWIWY